jgi:hypothetical protein
MAEAPRSRRSALEALGLFLLGAAGLWRFLTPRAGAGRGLRSQSVQLADEEIPIDGALVLPQFSDLRRCADARGRSASAA